VREISASHGYISFSRASILLSAIQFLFQDLISFYWLAILQLSIMSNLNDDIKETPGCTDLPNTETGKAEVEDHYEVFKRGEGQVDFRTVSWIRAGIIFLKSKPLLPNCPT
jgi:hypothetical protein